MLRRVNLKSADNWDEKIKRKNFMLFMITMKKISLIYSILVSFWFCLLNKFIAIMIFVVLWNIMVKKQILCFGMSFQLWRRNHNSSFFLSGKKWKSQE